MTTAGVKTLSFDEWQALPETKRRCEVVDGVLLMAPGPIPEHQWLGLVISRRMSLFAEARELGVVLTAPCDVVIRREPLRVRQPDVLFISAERGGVRCPADLVGLSRLEMPPDLVVEVLSPSNTRRQVEEKLADYSSIGVLEGWLVNFPARTVEVLRLSGDDVAVLGVYGMGDVLRSEALPGFELPIADIFGPLLG